MSLAKACYLLRCWKEHYDEYSFDTDVLFEARQTVLAADYAEEIILPSKCNRNE